MDSSTILFIGYLAMFFQAIRIIPQVIKGFTTKSVKDVSLWWIVTGAIGAVLWTTYGALTSDLPIIIGNVMNLVCYGLLMLQKRIY